MIIFTTAGFEERYILREIFRRGVKDKLTIYILTPWDTHEKTERALRNLKEMLAKFEQNIFIEKLEVPINTPYVAIAQLRKMFAAVKDQEIVFHLSGGPRLLIFCVLAAISSLGLKDKLAIESEDGSIYFETTSDVLIPLELDETEIKILNFLQEKRTLKELLDEFKLSRVTLWRKLKKLKKLALIDELEKKKYVLTDLGIAKLR